MWHSSLTGWCGWCRSDGRSVWRLRDGPPRQHAERHRGSGADWRLIDSVTGLLGATEPETDFPLFLEWARADKFPLGKLVTNRYSLEQIEEARVALEEGQILGRAIIEIRGHGVDT